MATSGKSETMYGEVGRLADEATWLSIRMAENAMLLAMATSYAWIDSWYRGYWQAGDELRAHMERQARTSRLMRRGVPAAAAARGLRIL